MKSPNRQDSPWVLALSKMKERLDEPVQWYPFPAMIGFMLVVILGGHLLPDLNPRLGSKVDVLPLDAPRNPDGGIWLSASLQEDDLVVVTSDTKIFRGPSSKPHYSDIEPLIQYLKSKTQKESYSMALTLEAGISSTTAVLALHQNLNYGQIKPLIFALASAKISRYGFETRIIH